MTKSRIRIGLTVGRWTVENLDHTHVRLRCACGTVRTLAIHNWESESCGCAERERRHAEWVERCEERARPI